MTTARPLVLPRPPADLTLGRSNPGPWALAQFGRVTSLWLTALILLCVSWAGARSDADPANAGLWILLGILGGLVAGAGSTFWLVSGTRSVRARQQVLVARIAAAAPQLEQALGVQVDQPQAITGTTVLQGVVRVDQGTRYHRADCLMVAGKTLLPMDHVDPALAPCGVCRP